MHSFPRDVEAVIGREREMGHRLRDSLSAVQEIHMNVVIFRGARPSVARERDFPPDVGKSPFLLRTVGRGDGWRGMRHVIGAFV